MRKNRRQIRILVTAGATWTKIDEVRVLTNIFTGKMGLYLAKALKAKGYSVTLIINPHCTGKITKVKAIYYHFFDEFGAALKKILKIQRFDAIIHMAAVSDYILKRVHKGKISSGQKELNLKLVPAKKIIKMIRRLAKKSILIQFKLEMNREGIIKKAYDSLRKNDSDFVVANALEDLKKKYQSFIINREGKITKVNSKKSLIDNLNRIIQGSKCY